MNRSIFILTLFALIAHLRAGAEGNPDQEYYTERPMYQSRPNPASERYFGGIGTTGLKARIYPGVVLKVEEMAPGSPSEGKFSKGEILTGINGTALRGLNPFVAMGNALTKAEGAGRWIVRSRNASSRRPPPFIPIRRNSKRTAFPVPSSVFSFFPPVMISICRE